MLYWQDPPAAVSSKNIGQRSGPGSTSFSGTINYPQLLDSFPANVDNAATTGADHTNNIEQVVINNPVAGNYTFTEKGTQLRKSRKRILSSV